jgi:hypothetical protein
LTVIGVNVALRVPSVVVSVSVSALTRVIPNVVWPPVQVGFEGSVGVVPSGLFVSARPGQRRAGVRAVGSRRS